MKYLLIFALSVISLTGYGQKLNPAKVPAAVKAKFIAIYPNIKNPTWELEDGNYEAGFDLNKVETTVVFTPAGVHVATESIIDAKALPAPVIIYVSKNYPGQKINEASKIVAANGKITYEAEVKGKDLIFDEKGNLLK